MSYAIMVTDAHSGSRLELCRVNSNPQLIAEAAARKTYKIGRRKFRMYSSIEVVEVPDER